MFKISGVNRYTGTVRVGSSVKYYRRQKKCRATKKVSLRENCYNFFSIKDRDEF